MKKLLALSIIVVLAACEKPNVFSEELTSAQESCRSESVEVAFQIIASIDPKLTDEKFNLTNSIQRYKEKGCSPSFVKNALNTMTSKK
jgi:hypothetical protein